MKNLKNSMIIFMIIVAYSTVYAQQTQTAKPNENSSRITNKATLISSRAKKCKSMNIRNIESILRDKVGRTLKVHLDKDYGSIEIMGKKHNVNFSRYKVKKPAHNWEYSLNDIKSEITRVSYSKNIFYLTINLEREGNEIKGRCPGCRFGKDKRAPDINWTDPKLHILIKPIAYNGSMSFEVIRVDTMGKFKLNGPTSKFFPSVAAYFKGQIGKIIKSNMEKTFNDSSVKRMLANAFAPEIRKLNVGYVKRIDISRENIYLCNY